MVILDEYCLEHPRHWISLHWIFLEDPFSFLDLMPFCDPIPYFFKLWVSSRVSITTNFFFSALVENVVDGFSGLNLFFSTKFCFSALVEEVVDGVSGLNFFFSAKFRFSALVEKVDGVDGFTGLNFVFSTKFRFSVLFFLILGHLLQSLTWRENLVLWTDLPQSSQPTSFSWTRKCSFKFKSFGKTWWQKMHKKPMIILFSSNAKMVMVGILVSTCYYGFRRRSTRRWLSSHQTFLVCEIGSDFPWGYGFSKSDKSRKSSWKIVYLS